MSNQLQENLDAILLDKNTNLKPENLKEGVTCLGVEGTGYLGKNIYGALDYTSKTYTIEKIANPGYPPYPDTYIFGKLTIRHSQNTNMYIYFDGEFIDTYDVGLRGSSKYIAVVYYDDEQYIFIVNKAESSTTKYGAISVNFINKTVTDLGEISNIDDISSLKTTGKECQLDSDGYLYRYQKDTNTFKKYQRLSNSTRFTGNNFAIFKYSHSSHTGGYVNKFTYDELSDTYNIISVQRDGVDGVNFYGNKIFINGNVYTLNADLSVGELLAENVYTVNEDNNIYFLWINEKYVIYDSMLYYWDDTNNTFTEYIPMEYATLGGYSVSNSVDITQYTFTNSEEIIGVNINGRDFYFSRGQIDGTSDEVLFGKTVYTSGADVILGTMPNNGDVTIEPTVEQQTKSSGYYNSLQVNPVTSSIDANIKAENIKKDISILGVTGTLEAGIDTSDANATADDIARGKTAYVNGEKIIGNIYTLGSTSGTTVDANGDVFALPDYNSGMIRATHSFSDEAWLIRQNGQVNYDITYGKIRNAIKLTGEQIKLGETVLGVEGTVIELKGQTKSVTPTVDLQTITPDENYNGLTSVEVSAVTSAIDSNIIPENIKKDITILDVVGTYEGSGTASEIEITTAIVDKTIQYIPYKEDGTSLWNTSSMTDMYEFAKDCVNLKDIPLLNTSSVTDMSYMFDGCTSLTTISLLDTSSVTAMQEMFYGCSSLITIPQLNTSSVENTMNMFDGCTSLITIPLIDTSNVTSMSSMFDGCTTLITIPQLDISSAEEVNNMFNNCTSLTIIPQLDTSSAIDMSSMFSNCTTLVTVPQLNMNSADSITNIFANCNSLSNDSLNNILASLLTATSYSGTKTLARIGLSSTQATTCTTLANWLACESAGWTTGY